jgi:hypothetical protein
MSVHDYRLEFDARHASAAIDVPDGHDLYILQRCLPIAVVSESECRIPSLIVQAAHAGNIATCINSKSELLRIRRNGWSYKNLRFWIC